MLDTSLLDKPLTEGGEKAVAMWAPEAEEAVKLALSERSKMSSENGYSVIWNMIMSMNQEHQESIPDDEQRKNILLCFLIACVRAGYPQSTADQIVDLMGWNG